ncbi:NAD(P)H-dependent oxidoreductase [Nocardia sp. XZ_19_385]|uniref:NAD(P)H-dependent oxidoreductase n=1 Tax=Nocardia sp. XZ_19_385 TaxID=2769488 RepID=UPI001890B529|nr:NAD(P)H-dependent oxidoreductase [Nocardia sp. XZ_19_385]
MTNDLHRPNVLLVVSHPDHDSASWALTRAIEEGIRSDGSTAVTVHDLTATGFDPVFTAADLAVHRLRGEVPADVAAEHRLVESADVVVVLFPVYWWSLPALAKGWIDRVFSRGWAYENSATETGSAIDELHFVGLAGVTEGPYDRRGYKEAMTVQLQHGIAGYSAIPNSSLSLLYGTETTDPAVHQDLAAQAFKLGADLAQRAQAAFDGV